MRSVSQTVHVLPTDRPAQLRLWLISVRRFIAPWIGPPKNAPLSANRRYPTHADVSLLAMCSSDLAAAISLVAVRIHTRPISCPVLIQLAIGSTPLTPIHALPKRRASAYTPDNLEVWRR